MQTIKVQTHWEIKPHLTMGGGTKTFMVRSESVIPCTNLYCMYRSWALLFLLKRCWSWDPLLTLLSSGRVRCALLWSATLVECTVRSSEFANQWFLLAEVASHAVKPTIPFRKPRTPIHIPKCVCAIYFSGIYNQRSTDKLPIDLSLFSPLPSWLSYQHLYHCPEENP